MDLRDFQENRKIDLKKNKENEKNRLDRIREKEITVNTVNIVDTVVTEKNSQTHKYLKLLTILPYKIKAIDFRLVNIVISSADITMPTEYFIKKILKLKYKRAELVEQYTLLSNIFNALPKRDRDCVGNIIVNNCQIRQVGQQLGIKKRTLFRHLERINNKFGEAYNNLVKEQVKRRK